MKIEQFGGNESFGDNPYRSTEDVNITVKVRFTSAEVAEALLAYLSENNPDLSLDDDVQLYVRENGCEDATWTELTIRPLKPEEADNCNVMITGKIE